MGLLPESVSQYTSFNWGGVGGSMMYWVGYGLILAIIFIIFGVIYYWLQFKINATVFPLVGSGNTTELAVGKPKGNKFKWNRTKTAWKSLWPLFNKKEVEPFDPKYIYNGNRIYAFKLGEEFIPGCININQDENRSIQAEINPVPHYIRNWQSMEHKKNAIEFAKHDWWNDNKTMIMTVIAVAICAGMVLGVSYMTYKFVAPTAASLDVLSDTIKNIVVIPGR